MLKQKEIAGFGSKRVQEVGKGRKKKVKGPTCMKRTPRKLGRSIADLDKDDDVTLVDETQERQDGELMFNTRVLDTDEMPVEAKVDEKDEQSTKLDDSTAGEAIKAAKHKVVTTAATTTTTIRPKARGVVVQEPSEFKAPQEAQPSISKDKGKGIMIEPEVPLKRKNQIALDEQIAKDIQAKLDVELIDEEKLARKQEEEANIAFIEHKRETQCYYLKHIGGYTCKQLKGKSFDEIQKLFDKEIKRVNTFVAMGSEVQESNEKKVEGSEEKTKASRKKMLGKKEQGKNNSKNPQRNKEYRKTKS
ncbi:putative ribonuclease H-like domain-containing protein [Tanacetum coccineum]